MNPTNEQPRVRETGSQLWKKQKTKTKHCSQQNFFFNPCLNKCLFSPFLHPQNLCQHSGILLSVARLFHPAGQ